MHSVMLVIIASSLRLEWIPVTRKVTKKSIFNNLFCPFTTVTFVATKTVKNVTKSDFKSLGAQFLGLKKEGKDGTTKM